MATDTKATVEVVGAQPPGFPEQMLEQYRDFIGALAGGVLLVCWCVADYQRRKRGR